MFSLAENDPWLGGIAECGEWPAILGQTEDGHVDSFEQPKSTPGKFKKLLRTFFDSQRVRFLPDGPLTIWAAASTLLPSWVHFALLSSADEDAQGTAKARIAARSRTGTFGWNDVEDDAVTWFPGTSRPKHIPVRTAIGPLLEKPIAAGRGAIFTVLEVSKYGVWKAFEYVDGATCSYDVGAVNNCCGPLEITRHDELNLPILGSFAASLNTRDFDSMDRKSFRKVEDQITMSAWAGQTIVEGEGHKGGDLRWWVLDVSELKCGIMGRLIGGES